MQASRKPRRHFAAPFVVTAAAALAPACIVKSGEPAPKQPVTTDDHRNTDNTGTGTGTGAGTDTGTVIHKNPPKPDTTQVGDPPGYQRNWNVDMQDDGSCLAYLEVACKKGAICNPPPPSEVACPKGITADGTMKIYAASGSWDCYITPPESHCPEKATCNPPPPRATACPAE